MSELDRASVPRRTSDGIIFSKRMVDDEKRRKNESVRKRKQRRNTTCPAPVPKMSSRSSSSTSSSIKEKKSTADSSFSLPEWMPANTWNMFLKYRKEKQAPVVKDAYPLFIEKFRRLNDAGWSPERVIDVMMEKGWRFFKPHWVKDEIATEERGLDDEDTKKRREWQRELMEKPNEFVSQDDFETFSRKFGLDFSVGRDTT